MHPLDEHSDQLAHQRGAVAVKENELVVAAAAHRLPCRLRVRPLHQHLQQATTGVEDRRLITQDALKGTVHSARRPLRHSSPQHEVPLCIEGAVYLQRAPNETLRALLGNLVHSAVQAVQAVGLYQVGHLRTAATHSDKAPRAFCWLPRRLKMASVPGQPRSAAHYGLQLCRGWRAWVRISAVRQGLGSGVRVAPGCPTRPRESRGAASTRRC